MNIVLCKAKLNKAVVTNCNVNYSGSIAIDSTVLEALKVYPYEKVLVVNRNNGARFETYVIPAERGVIELHGGTALLGKVGDTIGFLAFAIVDEAEANKWEPRIVELQPDGTITEI